MNEIVNQKRKELLAFIKSHIAPNPEVQAVIATGSIVTGLARPNSDIDAIIFFDPMDYYIVPAESKWEVGTDKFYSIFSPDLEGKHIAQFDFTRLDLSLWKSERFVWPESICALLKQGWIAFDRSGSVTELINNRTMYTQQLRLKKLDEAIVHIDQNLSEEKALQRWQTLQPVVAHSRLQAAYDYVIQALFAYLFRIMSKQRNAEHPHLAQKRRVPACSKT